MKTTVVGASGYTGGELLRILLAHPKVEGIEATSREHEGKKISSMHAELQTDLKFTDFDLTRANESDVVFLCVPHTKAMEVVPKISTKIVDLSADYRIKDKKVYERFYGVKHADPANLKNAVYGLPELHRGEIKKARVAANPGCYATNIILGLYPLVKKMNLKDIVVDSLTGNSGSGRGKVEGPNPPPVEENVIPYKVTGHRHTAELAQELGVEVSFVPHLLGIWRGIISTIHAKVAANESDALVEFQKFYKNEPFVSVTKEIPDVKSVAKTNDCVIGGFAKDKDKLIYFSVIDNLMKGASGQAVQNMNLMMGYKETLGLK
jgi:N-acetyl-gamma-glutamyl-phosphate reductase